MGWKEDVAAVVERLPARFSLRDVYRFAPELHRKHPKNLHIRDKIRQQLQVLRDEKVIQFLNNEGLYVRTEPSLSPVPDLQLEPDQLTTRDELARRMALRTSDPLRRGMFKPASGPLSNHLFLFHDERANPYGDVDEGDRVFYIGQGRSGDQSLTSYNRYLAEHLERGITVHYFVQPADQPGKVLYRGEVVVENVRRISRAAEGRSVIQFTLVPVSQHSGDPVTEYGNDYADILEYDQPPGPVKRERRLTLAQRVARRKAFGKIVLDLYERQCAVCGEPLHKEAAIELQGAHIMAVSENGPDEPRNGLSLCGRHHWAFDNGLFSLTDSHKILWFCPQPDPHGEIEPGEQIRLPWLATSNPHPEYLSFHRKKWELV